MAKSKSILQARQIRAARALLDWSQEDLAKASKVSVATIRKLEMGTISPRPATIQDIHTAIMGSGLEFIEPGGVRYLPEDITIYQGHEGFNAFLDDVYQTVRKKNGDIVIICSTESVFLPTNMADTQLHIERMNHLKDKVVTKCILTESIEILENEACIEYRQISPLCEPVSFYVYGDKCALPIVSAGRTSKIIVVQSTDIARSFRRQFQSIWIKSTPVMRGR